MLGMLWFGAGAPLLSRPVTDSFRDAASREGGAKSGYNGAAYRLLPIFVHKKSAPRFSNLL